VHTMYPPFHFTITSHLLFRCLYLMPSCLSFLVLGITGKDSMLGTMAGVQVSCSSFLGWQGKRRYGAHHCLAPHFRPSCEWDPASSPQHTLGLSLFIKSRLLERVIVSFTLLPLSDGSFHCLSFGSTTLVHVRKCLHD
jgi:hypothetical protein